MTNKELDNYMKTVNPNFDLRIEKGTIEMNNEYYNLLEEKMARLINQNQELKKQLEERTKMYQNAYDYSQKMEGKAIILEAQQKEFIKYLENYMKQMVDDYGSFKYDKTSVTSGEYRAYKEILQKYKEIIGVLNEKEN